MTTNHESIGSPAEPQLSNQSHEDPEDFYEFRARQDAAQAEQQPDISEREMLISRS